MAENQGKSSITMDIRYKGAWDETNMRTAARDQIILVYLMVSASFLAVAFKSAEWRNIALIIPYMSFVVTLLQCHHDFIVYHLNKYLFRMVEDNDWFKDKQYLGKAIIGGWFFTSASLATIVGFSAIALFLTKDNYGEKNLLNLLWCWGILITGISMLLIFCFRIWRLRVMRERT